MQSEEAVEIDHRCARNGDGGAHLVISWFAMGHNDVQSIGSAALEEDDHPFFSAPVNICQGSASQEARNRASADYCKGAVLQENSSCNGHRYLLWNSGDPKTS